MAYPNLLHIKDPALRAACKIMADRLNRLRANQSVLDSAVLPTLGNSLNLGNQRLTNLGTPRADQDGVTLALTTALIEQAITQYAQLVGTQSDTPPGPPPPPGTCNTNIAIGQPGGIPATLRWFKGNFCGIRVPGLPAVAGGSSDPSVVFTPFLDRYSLANQNLILTDYVARGYTHFKLSWPDSRDGNGQSIAQFVATCVLVQSYGLYPVVFLAAKGFDDPGNYAAAAGPIIGPLIGAGVLPAACVGWELSLWMSPTQVQQAIDYCVSQGVTETAGHNLYVHFQVGYPAFQQPGQFTSAFWQANVSKLTGCLYQGDPSWSCHTLQDHLFDIQVRQAGGAGWPSDSGFGHPIDFVADELTAMSQFFGGLSEAGGDQQGFYALCAPGPVPVSGFLNGAHT